MNEEAKCSCQFCNGHIAFDRAIAGQIVICPHCGLETKLFIPPIPAGTQPAVQKTTNLHHKPHALNVETKQAVSPLGIASLTLGITGCVFCWIPILGLFSIPIALIGLVLAFVGIVISAIDKKTGFVFSISGGIACIICVCVAFVTTGAIGKLYSDSKKTNQIPITNTSNNQATGDSPNTQSSTNNPNEKPTSATRSLPSFSDWTQYRAVKSGDIRITLLKTHIETQRSIASYEPQYRNLVLTNGFAVEIEIKNITDSKIVRGRGWSGANNITLVDNFGNQYPQNTYRNPDPRWPSPPLLDEYTLYPNQSTKDFMRFDTLVKNVQWLHLELPAENFGGNGMIRFEIPINKITIQWPPPY